MTAQSWVETTLPPGYAVADLLPFGDEGCSFASGSTLGKAAYATHAECNRAAWRHWTAAVLRGRDVEWCGPALDFRASPVCSGRWESDIRSRRIDRAAACGEVNAARVARPDVPTLIVGTCADFDLEQIEADNMGGCFVRPWAVWEFPSEYQRADIDEAMARFAALVLATEGPR